MGIQVFCWAGKFRIFHSQSWAGKLPVGQVSQKFSRPAGRERPVILFSALSVNSIVKGSKIKETMILLNCNSTF